VIVRGSLVLAAVLAVLVVQPSARSAGATHECGLPDARPLWIDYGEGSVPPDVRAVFRRPGVVVTASGTTIPRNYRAAGAATTYFVLQLPRWIGEPSEPADPATIQQAADRLFDQAVASTECTTPWIALNELLGSHLGPPWSATNAQYRANVLALVQRLAQRGAHPALLVHGNPNVAGDAAAWWRDVGAAATIVYEAYYNSVNIARLGPVIGPRRIRMGMRSVVRLFTGVGVPRERLGFMLGFQVAPGAAGREGLQPREEWFRVVKWNALAARQVALDERTSSVWSWGWGVFGPASVDPDKPAAACVYLWTRDPALCDGPAAAGPGFNTSLTEGPIVLPAGVRCVLPGGAVSSASVTALAALTRDPQLAFTALFARAALRARVPVPQTEILRVEREAIGRVFGGSTRAYLRRLARRHATRTMARGVIADELRRQLIAQLPEAQTTESPPLVWSADLEATAVNAATCLRDQLPGTGDFPRTDAREIGVVPLPAFLPFLFADTAPPAPPQALAAAPGTRAVTLDWTDSRESDATGYVVFRGTAAGGPYVRLHVAPLTRSTFVDATAPAGVPSYYVVRAVDSSRNKSAPSAEVSAAPA
jgi:hypothetical protein